MDAHATCYGGHQFGNWAGQLGDGRAINLGEVNTEQGHLMLQLKGAGPTPFSRSADGLAVLRSSLREYLCSEAMYHLGVPTTRALSLIGTGEGVMRPCTMVTQSNPRRRLPSQFFIRALWPLSNARSSPRNSTTQSPLCHQTQFPLSTTRRLRGLCRRCELTSAMALEAGRRKRCSII